MYFFTDPTIAALTSGRPSQTIDLGGFSFPRRVGVRFHPDHAKRNHYVGLQCVFTAYEDNKFQKNLGKEFGHTDTVQREGWARYFFEGKFPKDTAYVKLDLRDPNTGYLVHTFYFRFKKRYMTSLDGRTYQLDPILGTRIVKDGTLTEMLFNEKTGKYEAGTTTFRRKSLVLEDGEYVMREQRIPVITQNYVKYTEKPKALFMVTPPHLMSYAKLVLIILKQLVDLNFSQSYMTKENQKPLYATRYMLDELGNLQNEGHGISGLSTMLSIGLGQDQRFTLILQTLQQLRLNC